MGHGSAVASSVVFDVAFYGDANGEVRGHLAWVPPEGTPTLRRDVLALHASLLAAPVVVPASDGVVVVVPVEDETGTAVDAYHVRCDLVALPPSP